MAPPCAPVLVPMRVLGPMFWHTCNALVQACTQELTQEDPETPWKKPSIMSPSHTNSPETPTGKDETGYEADEEAQEEEPCFFIDVKGEPLRLHDDDFSDDDESFTW